MPAAWLTLTRLLGEVVRVDAGLPEVVDAYADLTVLDLRGGHNTKDNDLWIAATAKATGAVLLTCDHDFDWLNPATDHGLLDRPSQMSTDTQQIVNKAWNFAHVLRDDGLSYMAYTEQITFLLFLKMADEQTKPPYNRPPIVPAESAGRAC